MTIGAGVTSIGRWAFICCVSLTTIAIPEGVSEIGLRAFEQCKGLTSIIVNATTPPRGAGRMFEETDCPIYVPPGSVDAYKAAEYWSEYASRIVPIE